MEKITKNLEKLGLAGKEIDAYLALLKLKSASVIQLAKATSLKRTTVYHCLESLIGKNLATTVVKNDKKLYVAEDPKEALGNLLKEKQDTVQEVVPELKNIFGIGLSQPEIKIYRNVAGLRKLFEDLLKSQEKIDRYYLSGTLLEELLGAEFVENFVKKRIKLGITSLSLRAFEKYHPEWEQGETHSQQNRKVKFLPEKYVVSPYLAIYDDKVVVISGQEKMGFIIQSPEFAQAQKTIFDLLWETVAM